ncbi:MAG TPA: PD-(D/E)XK nuclease-like domain-containing protein [Pseudothermotoga sp.]
MNLTRENYYDFGVDSDEIIVSNSSLSHINPNEGGSLKRFMNYIRGKNEKEESKSFERGKLLHKFLEDNESFVLSPDDKPSDAVCAILETMRREIINAGITPGELHHHEDLIIQVARRVGFGSANWSSETVIKKIREKGDAYFTHLNNADGKIMTDAKTRQILDAIFDGLKSNPYTWDNYILSPPGVQKELPILFELYGFTCKALLDNVAVDFEKKTAKIRDVKSTSKPVGNYLGHYQYRHATEKEWSPGPFVWYHTYRQLAFYDLALRSWLTQQGEPGHKYKVEYEVLACETIEPYEHIVYHISDDWIKAGLEEVKSCFTVLNSELKYGNETFNNRAIE